jgi:hypothetical protein
VAACHTLAEGSAVSIAPGPLTGLFYPSEITRIPGTLRQLKLVAREMESQSQDILYIGEENSVSRVGLHLYLDEEELMAKVFEKAEDTFETEDTSEVQHAKIQLQVTRTVKASIGEQNGAIYVLRSENVRNVSHIETLLCVREHLTSCFCFNTYVISRIALEYHITRNKG